MTIVTCCIHGCERPLVAKFLCGRHYDRLRKTGTTLMRKPPRWPCRMPNCTSLRVSPSWCAKHKKRIQVNGSPLDSKQKFVVAPKGSLCMVCGATVPEGAGYRRYCSKRCALAKPTYEDRPASRPCVKCGTNIDLYAKLPSGRLRHQSKKFCDACEHRPAIIQFLSAVIERDGLNCGICGDRVNLALKHPEYMSRSLDHVLPRSMGGADDLSNLQLTHLICNIRKSNRVEVSLVS